MYKLLILYLYYMSCTTFRDRFVSLSQSQRMLKHSPLYLSLFCPSCLPYVLCQWASLSTIYRTWLDIFADRFNSNLFAFCAVNQETSQKQFPVRLKKAHKTNEKETETEKRNYPCIYLLSTDLSFVSISERLTNLLILLWYINSVLYKAQQSSLYIYVVEKNKTKQN